MMALAVIGDFDVARLPRRDGITRELAGGAAAALLHAGDDQRSGTSVGEMEGVGDHLALQNLPEVELRLFKRDLRPLSGRVLGRLRIGHQIGGKQLLAIVMARKQDHRKANQNRYAEYLLHAFYLCFVRIITAPSYCTTSFRPLHFKI